MNRILEAVGQAFVQVEEWMRVESDAMFVKNIISTIVSGFLLYILKKSFDALFMSKKGLKNYNGAYFPGSLSFIFQILGLLFVAYLLIASYIFFILADMMGLYNQYSYLIYGLTTVVLIIRCVISMAGNPLRFINQKPYQGGMGLIVGSIFCISGVYGILGNSLFRDIKHQMIIWAIGFIGIAGIMFICMLAILFLDTKKQYRYQWARLYLCNNVTEENIIVGTFDSKGEWLQYKRDMDGKEIENIVKKESVIHIEYYNMKRRKKLVQINTVCNNSTGHIMHDIQKQASAAGWDALSLVGRRKVYKDLPCEKYGSGLSFWIHVIITTLFDRQGHGSLLQTKRLVARLKEEDPDVIHLHNLHGYYLHIPTLFKFLKKEYKGKVFWTFHDLWPITGHCAYYTMAKCDKWKAECNKCPNKKVYPISWGLDQSKRNYLEKRKLFSGLERLEIITPSQWVAEQVKESFLKEMPIHVVPNGIDLEAFQYTEDDSIYEKYPIPRDKKIILGVASIWEKRKGLEDFLNIAAVLPEEYSIVLVGLSKKQMRNLPSNVIGISKTETKEELVVLYSIADVFLNPSREETFSLVTIEAMACGTPVIALDTSAVKELINSENGIVVSDTDVQEYVNAIKQLEIKKLDRKDIRATVLQYSENSMAEKILELYED